MKNSRKLIVDSGQLFAVCCERSGRSASYGHRTAHPLRVLLFSVFSLLFSACSFAEELPDPTRPPVGIAEQVVEAGIDAVIPPAGLQSILIGKHRRAAIIDGQTVELGDRIGDARLVEVNTANVVLRTAHGKQVLTLFPEMKIFVKSAGTNASATVKKVRTPKPVFPGEKK